VVPAFVHLAEARLTSASFRTHEFVVLTLAASAHSCIQDHRNVSRSFSLQVTLPIPKPRRRGFWHSALPIVITGKVLHQNRKCVDTLKQTNEVFPVQHANK